MRACADPWKSNESYQTCFVEVDGDAEANRDPKPSQEATESIQVMLIPITALLPTVLALQRDRGFAIESKVFAFAQGLWFAGGTA